MALYKSCIIIINIIIWPYINMFYWLIDWLINWYNIDCVMPKGSKWHFWHFYFFTDYDTKSNYAPPVKFLAVNCTSYWCFWRLNIFWKDLSRSICVRAQVTVLKGAIYGKAVIHKGAKRQLIRLVLMMASGLQFIDIPKRHLMNVLLHDTANTVSKWI